MRRFRNGYWFNDSFLGGVVFLALLAVPVFFWQHQLWHLLIAATSGVTALLLYRDPR